MDGRLKQFENDVEMYGAQTKYKRLLPRHLFENDVEMYGAQTFALSLCHPVVFENDVEMYGAQTMYYNKVIDP